MDLELLSMYTAGGLHPVHLGDRLGERGQFKVIHKLGYGAFSTVWLCHDTLKNKWRAVKIIAANHSDSECPDLLAAEFLGNPTEKELDAHHLALPLESFRIQGPNGSHLCIVLPLLGPSTRLVGQLYCCNSSLGKHVAHQMSEAMAYIHSKGVCHGDFRTDNILFRIQGADKLTEDDMFSLLGDPETLPVDDSDPAQHNFPEYLVYPVSFPSDCALVSRNISVVDFGISHKVNASHTFGEIPFEYAAPELLLADFEPPLGFGADIWALGCAIFELRTGLAPFGDEKIDWVLENVEEVLGSLPEPYRSMYIDSGYTVYNQEADNTASLPISYRIEDAEAQGQCRLAATGTTDYLEDRALTSAILFDSPAAYADGDTLSKGLLPPCPIFDAEKQWTYQMSRDELPLFLDLVKRMWKYEPDKRARPGNILDHPWFDGRDKDWYQPEKFEAIHTAHDISVEGMLEHDLSDFPEPSPGSGAHTNSQAAEGSYSFWGWIKHCINCFAV
ncbi:kinase-like protein [Thozetella sp. PMI_491]|nr:kinase-like protein [Thozetella sp. PMI_491]